MTTLGYFLSCEEFHPRELVRQAVRAEAAGFERLWISDHYHPWIDAQGHGPFVWSAIGALSQACSLPVTTAVTCRARHLRLRPGMAASLAGNRCDDPKEIGQAWDQALAADGPVVLEVVVDKDMHEFTESVKSSVHQYD